MRRIKRMIRPFCCFLFVCLLFCATTLSLPVQASAPVRELIPGGMAFGIKYYAKGAIVIGVCDVETAAGLCSPARKAGLEAGDIITSVGGKEIDTLEELMEHVQSCDGKRIEIGYTREDRKASVSVTPALDKTLNAYRLGIWVRDSTAGIGTVTFIDADTKRFGGLGHGINDSATGKLLPFGKGSVVDVVVTGSVRGRKSIPGELKGEFGKKERGSLFANTDYGVFGTFTELPANLQSPIPVASPNELHTGKACIRSTVDGTVGTYTVEIEELYADSGKTKNFLVHVTDERLLGMTGGIVQGMSGSPILQDGKLVGAVTHVLVNDPTRGFGIRIENMLSELDKHAA